ncbi:hypothetical protein IDM40_18740 [Nocardiopsis sp. HNM0947]|uniref:Uncharacterized protein n=1 Tax=Nocardiopsis coralli TaxID=2772213 RepID=A0ABR9PA49_9ACTN|nr:hypothetical protein [Nocardiopsis coralli]
MSPTKPSGPDACHGATASGETVVRDEADAGYWARANAKRATMNNESFYSAEC